jgi:hypothetical protein
VRQAQREVKRSKKKKKEASVDIGKEGYKRISQGSTMAKGGV